MTQQFFGKYRGKVINNADPQALGRLQVVVPAVSELPLGWAMPCVPYAGMGVGFYAIPPQGANVWVEFEGGDPDYPIWSGCFWSAEIAPDLDALARKHIWKTATATITMDDTPGGGVKIESISGARIELSGTGIEINNGQGASITLTGPQISLHDGSPGATGSQVT